MNSRVVFVDIDDILFPFNAEAVKRISDYLNRYISPSQITSWEYYKSLKIEQTVLQNIFNSVHLQMMNIDPIDGAPELLEFLYNSGYYVTIISAIQPEFFAVVRSWLLAKCSKNGKINFHSLILGAADKRLFINQNTRLIIDDKPQFLQEIGKYHSDVEAYTLEYPYNRELKGSEPNIHFFSSLRDMKTQLLGFRKEIL